MTAGKAPTHIAIRIEAPGWDGAEWRPLLRRAVRAALKRAGAGGRVNLLLTGDGQLQRLNRDFRGKDKPTNVLSFPAAANPEGELGDIAIAHGVADAEARAAHKRLADHAVHLAVHGTLHLLGYDHARAAEAEAMEALEVTILAGLGIADPYVEAA